LALAAVLMVGCGGGDNPASPTTPSSVSNTAPVARAGSLQNVVVGSTVTLDGSASSDADGNPLSYSWSLAPPSGSAAKLSSNSTAKPSFFADVPGNYQATLVVNDGTVSSTSSSASVTASVLNAAPVANAGLPQSVLTGVMVTLDGSASSDADGDAIKFDWILVNRPAGSAAVLSAPSSAKPSFTADLVGNYVASLSVFDGKVYSTAAIVTVSAAAGNVAPVAHAGVAQNALKGALVTLDGSASSDANNDAMTYQWILIGKPVGSAATLAGATTAKPSFTADLAGDYVASLKVSDGKLDSAPVTVAVAVTAGNVAPVAVAGPLQNVAAGTTVTLDGSASFDGNRDPLTYRWMLNVKPASSTAALSGAATAKPTFTADVAGVYVASLQVSDGKLSSALVTVPVTAAVANSVPVANAGAAQNVAVGSAVTLDGTASSDADGNPLTYHWTLTSKPLNSGAALSSGTSPKPTFSADLSGVYVASLYVNDGLVDSAYAVVTVVASAINSAPVAEAGAGQNVIAGSLVTLDGSASSDADRDSLTFIWSLSSKPAGSSASLSSATSARPSFTADVPGTYVASLLVSDGKLSSALATVPVTASAANVAPVAAAGPAQSVLSGVVVTLDGTPSVDANGYPLTYRWTLTSRPAGSTAALNTSTSAMPTFTADLPGVYVATLSVNNGLLTSTTVTVPVTASAANAAPVAHAGPAQNVITGSLVTLDGSASSDANRDPLTFRWSLSSKPSGSTSALSASSGPRPTFTADAAGTYVASLLVNDGQIDSVLATVPITATVGNAAPVANAGAGQSTTKGSVVTLDASASSDANGDSLTYRWVLTSRPPGSAAVLSSSSIAKPTFTADVAGVFVASLIVSDGKLSSAWTTVPIVVR